MRSDPAALTGLPWLQELCTSEVAAWFALHGAVPDRPVALTHLPSNLITDAVRRGDGITCTARAFFRDDLAAGRVVELFSESALGIYRVETQQKPLRPEVEVFLDGLFTQAETAVA